MKTFLSNTALTDLENNNDYFLTKVLLFNFFLGADMDIYISKRHFRVSECKEPD